jgi:hypothetical protein
MNNVTEKHRESGLTRVKELGAHAVAAAGEQVEKAAEKTGEQVKKYPFAAMGIAFASGLALGAAAWALFRPRPPTLKDRLDDVALGKRLHRLFDRLG